MIESDYVMQTEGILATIPFATIIRILGSDFETVV